MKKKIAKRVFSLVLLSAVFIFLALRLTGNGSILPKVQFHQTHAQTFWEYQCIDTMKTSRDKAHAWKSHPDLKNLIDREMKAIKDMGANCVALDTPYDEEFLPYLKEWVASARKHRLKIWFRGNFAAWEGWFGYPRGMTADELFSKTQQFITDNPDLFRDGDIFTPAPEGENGGPFNQVEKDEHEVFRKFLIEEEKVAKDAFDTIGKNVTVNWMSMNGGLARRMFDQPTIDALDKTVALDHYIKTAPEMGEYIRYFADKYGAKVVIGEFGAPIPEINGEMTEDQQAAFIDELFRELYREREDITGINYWVLFDSSTELYNREDFTPRKAVEVVRQYMKPTRVIGKITNTLGDPLTGVVVETRDGFSKYTTESNGELDILIPAKGETASIVIKHNAYITQTIDIPLGLGKTVRKNVSLTPLHESFLYNLRLKLRGK